MTTWRSSSQGCKEEASGNWISDTCGQTGSAHTQLGAHPVLPSDPEPSLTKFKTPQLKLWQIPRIPSSWNIDSKITKCREGRDMCSENKVTQVRKTWTKWALLTCFCEWNSCWRTWSYVGGHMKCCSPCCSDLWGLMLLWRKKLYCLVCDGGVQSRQSCVLPAEVRLFLCEGWPGRGC